MLNGMWAFALWDAEKKRLFISRDRFGKKPLFWFNSRGTFVFASELTALLEHPHCPRSVSPKALQKFFAYALVPAPCSLIEGVWKLPGGHNLIFDVGDAPVIKRYWRFEIEPDDKHDAPVPRRSWRRILERLERAVKRRLMADVPLGGFSERGYRLNGGGGLGRQTCRRGIGCAPFVLDLTRPCFDESASCQARGEFLGTDHRCEILDLDKACDVLPEIFASWTSHRVTILLLPTWLLSRFTQTSCDCGLRRRRRR